MADFDTDFNFMMTDEDSTQAHALVPDAPGTWAVVAGAKTWQGAWAISGINSKAFPADFAAIAALPQNQRGPAVELFYETLFWNTWEGSLSDAIAERVLDTAVNRGGVNGVKVLQMAVNACGGSLTVDGRWGPATVAAANACDQDALLAALRAARLADYQAVVAANPSDAQYLGTAEAPGPWWIRALK